MPNEVWHIDVTEVKTINNETVYTQIVYDNFSRYVIAWKVISEISGLLAYRPALAAFTPLWSNSKSKYLSSKTRH
jgi:transposase InsO family protein